MLRPLAQGHDSPRLIYLEIEISVSHVFLYLWGALFWILLPFLS